MHGDNLSKTQELSILSVKSYIKLDQLQCDFKIKLREDQLQNSNSFSMVINSYNFVAIQNYKGFNREYGTT